MSKKLKYFLIAYCTLGALAAMAISFMAFGQPVYGPAPNAIWYILFFAAGILIPILLLICAWKLYKNSPKALKLLKPLLYLQIPYFETADSVLYVYYGMWFAITGGGGSTGTGSKSAVSINFELGSGMGFSNFTNLDFSTIILGINIVPIILLILIRKSLRK